jgi:heme A synthase
VKISSSPRTPFKAQPGEQDTIIQTKPFGGHVTTESPSPHPQYGSNLPKAHPRNDLGIAALVVGILAVAFCWFPFAGVVFGLAAVLMAVAGRRRIKRGQANNRGTTVAGLALGLVAIIVSGAISTFLLFMIISYENCIDHAGSRAEYGQC